MQKKIDRGLVFRYHRITVKFNWAWLWSLPELLDWCTLCFYILIKKCGRVEKIQLLAKVSSILMTRRWWVSFSARFWSKRHKGIFLHYAWDLALLLFLERVVRVARYDTDLEYSSEVSDSIEKLPVFVVQCNLLYDRGDGHIYNQKRSFEFIIILMQLRRPSSLGGQVQGTYWHPLSSHRYRNAKSNPLQWSNEMYHISKFKAEGMVVFTKY